MQQQIGGHDCTNTRVVTDLHIHGGVHAVANVHVLADFIITVLHNFCSLCDGMLHTGQSAPPPLTDRRCC